MRWLAADLAPAIGCGAALALRSGRCGSSVNRELDQRCLELAVADLRELQPLQRLRALAQFRAIDGELALRLQLELAYWID